MADSKKDSTPPKKEVTEEPQDDLLINDSTQDRLTSPGSDQEGTDVGNGVPSDAELGQAMDQAEQEASQPAGKLAKPKKRWSRKKIALLGSAGVAVLIAVLMIVPVTRYAILGLAIKHDVTVNLRDAKTGKPVSNAQVTLSGKTASTDAKGMARLKSIPVGSQKVKAAKKYYKDLTTDVLVPIAGNSLTFRVNIEATGRQVPIRIVNKLSKQPIEGAQVEVDGTSAKTDNNGEAIVVLPADKTEIDARLSAEGYNKLDRKVTVTEQLDDKNTFALTPNGKLYFLSKRSGTIDVMKSDLDGGNVQTVLKGTGKEDESGTVLLASRDWKYLALKARRDSDKPKLYLIETSTSKLTVIDEGDADFSPVGWYNTHFVYSLHRTALKEWEPKRYALKSFNAASGSLGVLDETGGEGSSTSNYATEQLKNVYILENDIVYQKDWFGPQAGLLAGKSQTINSVRPDGSSKRVAKSYPAQDGALFGLARLYEPQELYIEVYQPSKTSFWEYEDGKVVEAKDVTSETFYSKYYPTYLLSPSGKNTFWYEPRDGKNTLFVGDADGKNGKEIATLSEFTPYGWMGEDYLLVSKKGSELFIIARDNPAEPLKVTDYHKPSAKFYGYGYGYGGL